MHTWLVRANALQGFTFTLIFTFVGLLISQSLLFPPPVANHVHITVKQQPEVFVSLNSEMIPCLIYYFMPENDFLHSFNR